MDTWSIRVVTHVCTRGRIYVNVSINHAVSAMHLACPARKCNRISAKRSHTQNLDA